MKVIVCDVCGARGAKEYSLTTGSQYNGVETVDIKEHIDICDKCYAEIFRRFLRMVDRGDRVITESNEYEIRLFYPNGAAAAGQVAWTINRAILSIAKNMKSKNSN